MVKKIPYTDNKLELEIFERTPKHVLFALARDFAIQHIGESEYVQNPSALIVEIRERIKILDENGLLP